MATPLPHTTETPVTPWTRWRKNPAYQSELAAFLASPTGSLLLDTLRFLATPQSPAVPDQLGGTPLERRAMQFSELVGYHQGLNNLISLSVPAAVPVFLPRPWEGRSNG